MQAEANEQKNSTTPAAPQVVVNVNVEAPQGSMLKTFLLVAVITLAILGGIGFYVFSLGDSNLPMNYPGFDNK